MAEQRLSLPFKHVQTCRHRLLGGLYHFPLFPVNISLQFLELLAFLEFLDRYRYLRVPMMYPHCFSVFFFLFFITSLMVFTVAINPLWSFLWWNQFKFMSFIIFQHIVSTFRKITYKQCFLLEISNKKKLPQPLKWRYLLNWSQSS